MKVAFLAAALALVSLSFVTPANAGREGKLPGWKRAAAKVLRDYAQGGTAEGPIGKRGARFRIDAETSTVIFYGRPRAGARQIQFVRLEKLIPVHRGSLTEAADRIHISAVDGLDGKYKGRIVSTPPATSASVARFVNMFGTNERVAYDRDNGNLYGYSTAAPGPLGKPLSLHMPAGLPIEVVFWRVANMERPYWVDADPARVTELVGPK